MLLNRSSQLFFMPFEEGQFWLINLENITPEEVTTATLLLDKEETKRASQFVFEKDRTKRVLAYAILKVHLGQLLQVEPEKITIARNEFQKPYLPDYPVHFNLSHTENYSFVGIHPFKAIGVDIEKRKSGKTLLDAVDSFVFPSEKEWLFSSSRSAEESIFTLWCAKEAFLKAVGTGFLSSTLPLLQLIPSHSSDYLRFTVKSTSHVYVYSHIVDGYTLAISCIHKQAQKLVLASATSHLVD